MHVSTEMIKLPHGTWDIFNKKVSSEKNVRAELEQGVMTNIA